MWQYLFENLDLQNQIFGLVENVTNPVILFEANFDDDDIDLLSALCGVSETTTMVTNTSSVMHTAPRVMFENCHIGAINITINKK